MDLIIIFTCPHPMAWAGWIGKMNPIARMTGSIFFTSKEYALLLTYQGLIPN
jgi:hypothetical protein